MSIHQGWQSLRPGDIVDIVAPGFSPTRKELSDAVRFLKSWQLVPRLPAHTFGKDVLCANTDEMRLKHLLTALSAKDSKAVWCIRGGYGSIRLTPRLLQSKRPTGSAKLFLGLSDITTLHAFLNQQWAWPTVHGPLLDRLGRKAALPQYERELKRMVFGHIDTISFRSLKPLNKAASRRKMIKASVSGGNLVVLQSTLATPSEWQTRGRILFFEDIGERGYRVDRVLEHFTQAGIFKNAKAIVFGDFTGSREPDGRNLVPAVLKRFAQGCPLPVLSGLATGHGVVQRPVPLGTTAKLILDGRRGELIIATGVAR